MSPETRILQIGGCDVLATPTSAARPPHDWTTLQARAAERFGSSGCRPGHHADAAWALSYALGPGGAQYICGCATCASERHAARIPIHEEMI